jgi:hypothetical protein
MHDAHCVERDVDAARLRRYCFGMLFYRTLIEGVNLCGFNGSATRGDVSRYSVELGLCPPGDKDSCAFSGKYSRHSSADSPASSVNNGILVS